jgi:hypothetical protein
MDVMLFKDQDENLMDSENHGEGDVFDDQGHHKIIQEEDQSDGLLMAEEFGVPLFNLEQNDTETEIEPDFILQSLVEGMESIRETPSNPNSYIPPLNPLQTK